MSLNFSDRQKNLLRQILQNAGWEIPVLVQDKSGGFELTGRRKFETELLMFRLFAFHSKEGMNAVTSFHLDTRKDGAYNNISILDSLGTFMTPEDVLPYWGKRWASEKVLAELDDKQRQKILWTITCPKHIVSLFEAYDELAFRLHKPQLFQPVPQGKAS